jgi:hypothetical protein
MESAWYPISDLPFGRVYVRLHWAGRQFAATRLFDHKRGEFFWAVLKGGDPIVLPPSGKEQLWEPVPEAWQPIDLSKWEGPLPDPVTPAEAGRLRTERMRFLLVEDADAADLAREMEAHREAARASTGAKRPPREPQWWRDATQIEYESPPYISRRMVEGRLMRALACCGAGSRPACELEISPLLAEVGEAAARALAEIEATMAADIVPRFQPLPADNDDFLVAMSWFAALDPPEKRPRNWQRLKGIARLNKGQRVLLAMARNRPLSFDGIGIMLDGIDLKNGKRAEIERRIHAAGERARYNLKAALEQCCRIANGMPRRSKRAKSPPTSRR